MSQQNVGIVRDQYTATNERDFRRAMAHYAEDVELVVPSSSSLNAGTFMGRSDVGRWFGDWLATFDSDARFDIEEIIDVNESSVLLVARHSARGRASGVEIEGDVIWIYRLRDGKIVHLHPYETRDDALKAVGLAE
jgi:ketosteroid isomerase-like protein